MGVDIAGLAPHRLDEALNALVEFALVLEHQAEIVARFEIVRIERQRLAVAGLGLTVATERAKCIAEVGMAARIARFNRDGAAVARRGGVKGAARATPRPYCYRPATIQD